MVTRAIQLTTQDFSVTCGVRTLAEQKELYAQGRTKPGQIVTWTLKSRHLPAADGLGRAVDLAPYPIDWNDLSKFDTIAKAMFQASEELGIPIRWGADWDQDGKPRDNLVIVDTEGGAATDDLSTINGAGMAGHSITLRAASVSRVVTVKDSTQLRLAGDFVMNSTNDTITLIWTGSQWFEVSRSDNA